MRRTLAAIASGVLAAAGTPACAEWSLSGELEGFSWAERVSPSVTETGPRLALGLRWAQVGEAAWRFAYEGRVYGGSPDYEGAFLFSGAPATGTTRYSGLANELQAIHRLPGTSAGRGAELVAGAGWDYWERELSAFQKEVYSVGYLRLGGRLNAYAAPGWFGGGGIKYPVYAKLDARLRSLGFDQNPALEPEGRPSLYADIGYRFNAAWSLAGYYDSYRFGASDPVGVTARALDPDARFFFFQPESRQDALGLRVRYRF
jgi:hypothetical protein